MVLMPIDPASRDFAVECFLEDWAAGRASRREAEALRAQLRDMGDVHRLEYVSRSLSERED